jgi:hypothetical protein
VGTRVLWRSALALAAVLLAPNALAAQDRQISGRIVRSSGQPIPDVEITVVGQVRYRAVRQPEGRTITAPQGDVASCSGDRVYPTEIAVAATHHPGRGDGAGRVQAERGRGHRSATTVDAEARPPSRTWR